MNIEIVKRNFNSHSSPSSSPVGCPGFCWLIDSVWPFVLLWKSIQQIFMLRVSPKSLHLNLFLFCHILSEKKRRQIKHSRVGEQFEKLLRSFHYFGYLFGKRKYLFVWLLHSVFFFYTWIVILNNFLISSSCVGWKNWKLFNQCVAQTLHIKNLTVCKMMEKKN